MTTKSEVELLFEWLDKTATEQLSTNEGSFLDALALAAEKLFEEEDAASFSFEQWNSEFIRKGLQLGILKGMKEGVQAHHAMTPDGVALFVAFLINKWLGDRNEWSLLDPATGTSNLLTAIINQSVHKPTFVQAAEVDETLMRLSAASANLQRHPIAFSHQDALQPMYMKEADVVVCDLPVGFYPGDTNGYSLADATNERMPFSHYLFIEQALRYCKDSGYLFLIVPNTLFEMDETRALHHFITSHALIHCFFQLPESMFQQKHHAKSILVLQKKGNEAIQPKDVLISMLPSLKDEAKVRSAMMQIGQWHAEHLQNKEQSS
ncbi:class I SAM-dependent methyltransferase [Aureibacillus halotolerans]|uniref:Site-specific DNA-methyltransferase (Adenine-specific) n=1 Tax=Aureibacillus halotolerans TaxID=1508390 RepID=A0A4V3D592_9BACI|nr:class I SAM-dependent methyltransferase [Aureibacillus halotolerans]TDQ39107.1 site-specific DNA-methyltransferase (adenine-specific) [Aureibacillus halotolerans]